MELPTLYSTDNKFWKIWVTKDSKIHIKYGRTNGAIREVPPATASSYEMACKKAKTKWERQKDSRGYRETVPTNKEIIVRPMGAYALHKGIHRLHFPAYVQPKLDGYRCLAHVDRKGEVILLSRQNRPHSHLDHIRNDIKKLKLPPNIYLDGELHCDQFTINDMRSLIGKKTLNIDDQKRMKMISYNLFDLIDLKNLDLMFSQRTKLLEKLFKKHKSKELKLVPTHLVKNEDEMYQWLTVFLDQGAEGIIVRNADGVYKLGGKSFDVLASKHFKTDKFIVSGCKEGVGDDKGTVVWQVECLRDKTKTFWVRPMGTREQRKEWFKNCNKWIGHKITIKYYEIDDKTGCVTRNPVATI